MIGGSGSVAEVMVEHHERKQDGSHMIEGDPVRLQPDWVSLDLERYGAASQTYIA
jgi:hypothetical protein